MLYRHAQTILRQVENTKAALTKKDDEISGTVSVGMPSSTAKLTALTLIKNIKQYYPGILLEVVDVPSADLASLLINGRIDFAIIPDPPKPKGVSLTPIIREELFWLTTNNFVCTSNPVTLAELTRYPLVLPSKPNTLRSRFEYKLVKRKLSYTLYAEASTSAILIPMVESGTANTILPYSSCYKEVQNKEITPHRIEEGFYRNIYICINEDLESSEPTQLVIEMYKNIIKQMIEKNTLMGWENLMK